MPTFAALLALHGPRVHRLTAGLLRDPDEAREVAQEALARAWAARDRFAPERPFYPWLATIARNACRDAAARGGHRAAPGLDAERVAGSDAGAFELLSARRAEQAVQAALHRVRAEHREILLMRHWEDLSYAEIGDALGVPLGTVMSRLYRARRALTEELRRLGHDEGSLR